MKQAIVLLVDGLRADAFEAALAHGELPAIQEHVIDRGTVTRGSSCFTSTTGPAHVPLLTGCFPGSSGLIGYRWFDRERYRPGRGLGPWCLRSYNGPEVHDRDLSLATKTLHELAGSGGNVFGCVARGATWRPSALKKTAIYLSTHYNGGYGIADRAARRYLIESLAVDLPFRFITFPAVDWWSHYVDRDTPEALESLHEVDRAAAELAAALQLSGRYDDTLLLVTSDHGHERVQTHFDLPVRMEEDLGMRVAYHSWKVFQRDPEAIAAVSGNAMAMIYLRADQDWRERPVAEAIDARWPKLRPWLLAEPGIDIVATRAPENSVLVESRRGRAVIAERAGGGVTYERHGDGDPFGYGELPRELDARAALEATWSSDYPDAPLQIVQLFRSHRCGDVVLSATPGWDLRERYENPEHKSGHGALHRDQMLVPIASSRPLLEGPLRTADLAACVLDHLELPLPAGIDGESRLVRLTPSARTIPSNSS